MKNYIPIFKSRDGELQALKMLSEESKTSVLPLLEILDDRIEDTQTKLLDFWNFESNSIILDPFNVEDIDSYFDMLNTLISNSVNAIPVLGQNDDLIYQNRVKEFIHKHNSRVCIRINRAFFRPIVLRAILLDILDSLDVDKDQIIVLFDVGVISEDNFDLCFNSSVEALTFYFRESFGLDTYVAGGSFPENLSPFIADTITRVPRLEWMLFNRLIVELKGIPGFNLKYGDYGIKFPVHDATAARFSATCSIKYTSSDDFVIFRGQRPNTHPLGGGQYNVKANELLNEREYDGANFSWADNEIEKIANREDRPGNAGTWVKIGQNRHLEKILSLL